jgi:5-(carboxyamino)imidazole ribonucleotide synthase
VLEALDYVGVLAFEFFVVGSTLAANEIAPRVHNSGHWSIEGAEVSQFENQLRAVIGLPLGPTTLRGSSAMVNLIGRAPDTAALLAIPGVHLHLYGKSPKLRRKIGHLTITAPDELTLEARLVQLLPLVEAAQDG